MIVTRSKMNCAPPNKSIKNRAGVPLMNVFVHEDNYSFEFLLPGVAKEQLDINIVEDLLKIDVNKKGDNETGEKLYSRRVRLPKNADKSEIQAQLENGILTLSMAKKAKEVTKITIS